MDGNSRFSSPQAFSQALYEKMTSLNRGITTMAFYEFRYALEDLDPPEGWEAVSLERMKDIEELISRREFFESVQLKPMEKGRIVLDASIVRLVRMLFAGLVQGAYPVQWVKDHFYFDIRGFYFLPRTVYFTDAVRLHLGGRPIRAFKPLQEGFELKQDIGYPEFEAANLEVDRAFIAAVRVLIASRGTPLLVNLAGPTAAGKTEITERLRQAIEEMGIRTTTIEMDNFLLDREYRDDKPMGPQTTHFVLFKQALESILQGNRITIPRYDFLASTSSHDRSGNLKPGCKPLQVEPAGIIFLEGNFPFHLPEIARLIGLKIVYLTDDPIRLKRKWKRDIDYRKKYDPTYFRNRFFRTQFLRADEIYRPLMETCDLVIDTTAAAIWAEPAIAGLLASR